MFSLMCLTAENIFSKQKCSGGVTTVLQPTSCGQTLTLKGNMDYTC